MAIGHKIILEGIDGAGKSTFASKLTELYPEMNYKIIHCTRHTPNNYEYFKDLLQSPDNIIFDRAMYGQFVYQTREQRRDKHQLSTYDLFALEEVIRLVGAEVYYVYSDLDVCLYNCAKDIEDSYYTMDYVKELDTKFRHLFDMSSLEIEYYYNDYHPNKISIHSDVLDRTKLCKTFDYSSLPEIIAVDFDGVLATDCFPDIDKAIPNIELINELKMKQDHGSKIILWTCRTDGSLVDACDFLANLGFYPDSINENVKEVKESLDGGPRKVYADMYIDDKAKQLIFAE